MEDKDKWFWGIHKERLHHAYCIEGEPLEFLPRLNSFLEGIGVRSRANPDFSILETETFSIDDARRVRELTLQKAVAEIRVIVIAARSLTREAQNALLKTLEEPAERTHFFLIIPSAEIILPTLRSRLELITRIVEAVYNQRASHFLAAGATKRLSMVRDILDSGAGEARSFLDHLEQLLAKHLRSGKVSPNVNALEEVMIVKKYLRDPAVNLRMILEHLSLVLPQFSAKDEVQR